MGGVFGLFGGHHNTTTRAQLLTEFQYNSSTYGEIVPVVIGTTRMSGNLIDYTDFTAHEHKTTQKSGKGGGSKSTSITYTYTVAVAIALCEGPIHGVRRVWENKDVYNYPTSKIPLDLFKGDYNQEPWPYMKNKHPERALPYSGLAYMAGVVDLGESSSMNSYNFEVEGILTETGDGTDVNPADYIYYILTDPVNGVGFSADDIDLESLDRARNYWAAADLLISSPSSMKAKKVQDVINTICELTGVYVFWSQNKLKFVPTCQDELSYNGHTYTPNRKVLFDLSDEDFIPQSDGALVQFERTDSSEAYNRATVEFTNRNNSYEKESASFEVTSDVLQRGVREASKITADYIYTKKRALFIAELAAKNYVYSRNTYTFSLDWAYSQLEVGDLVTLTDSACGMVKRPVVITSVKEDADGELTFEAVSVPDGAYSSAEFTTHEYERPTIDRTIEPANVEHVTLFQPSGTLTNNGMELWLGLTTTNEHWGGCNIHISEDNATYKQVGQLTNQCRVGSLVDAISADSTEFLVNLYFGELLGGSDVDAERDNTLIWLDGELISYTGAKLVGLHQYKLTGVLRGRQGTQATAHGKGASLARVDELLFKQPFGEHYVGRKIYLKFTSFNEFGANEQGLEDVEAYPYTLKPYYIPQVQSLTAQTRYRAEHKGIPEYDVVVSVVPPTITSYDKTAIFYQVTKGGQTSKWQFAGYTGTSGSDTNITIPQAVIGESYKIKAIVYDKHGYSSDDATAITTTLSVQAKSAQPDTPSNFKVTLGESVVASWNEVTNADIDYYELRLNDAAGTEQGLLAKVSATVATIILTERKSTVYLFAHNREGKYSYPVSYTVNKPKPKTPSKLTVKTLVQGLYIEMEAIPADAAGINLYINNEKFVLKQNTMTYSGEPGVYTVRYAFFDVFGEGDMSGDELGTINATIDPELIKAESLSLDKFDKATKEAINQAGADAERLAEEAKMIAQQANTNADNAQSTASSARTYADTKANELKGLINANTSKINTTTTTLDGIKTTIGQLQAKDTTLATQINTTASGVKTEMTKLVNDTKSGLQSNITKIEQTANGIKTDIANLQAKDTSLATQITQSASSVKTEMTKLVNDTKSGLQANITKVEQTANGIKTSLSETVSKQDAYARAISAMTSGTLLTAEPNSPESITGLGWYIGHNRTAQWTFGNRASDDPNTGTKRGVLSFSNTNTESSEYFGGMTWTMINARLNSRFIVRAVVKSYVTDDAYFYIENFGEWTNGGYSRILSDTKVTGDWQEVIIEYAYGDSLKSGKTDIKRNGYLAICRPNQNLKDTKVGTTIMALSSLEYYDCTNVGGVPNAVQTVIDQTAQGIKETISQTTTSTKTELNNNINSAKTALQNNINSAKSELTTKITEVQKTAEGVKTTVMNTVQPMIDGGNKYAQALAMMQSGTLLSSNPSYITDDYSNGEGFYSYGMTATWKLANNNAHGKLSGQSKEIQYRSNVISNGNSTDWGGPTFYFRNEGFGKTIVIRAIFNTWASDKATWEVESLTNWVTGSSAEIVTDKNVKNGIQEVIVVYKFGTSLASGQTKIKQNGWIHINRPNQKLSSANNSWLFDLLSLEVYDCTNIGAIPNAVMSQINQTASSITQVVNNLSTKTASQITQLQDGINLKVSKGDVINQINMSPTGTTIDGKYLHVTGTTKFDNNVITSGMLQANAVTADKIKADSLSAISANLGTVNGGKIIGGTLQNTSGSFSVDANGNIKGANITGSRIDASSVYQAGYRLKSVASFDIEIPFGTVPSLPNGIDINNCIFSIYDASTSDYRNSDKFMQGLSPSSLWYGYIDNQLKSTEVERWGVVNNPTYDKTLLLEFFTGNYTKLGGSASIPVKMGVHGYNTFSAGLVTGPFTVIQGNTSKKIGAICINGRYSVQGTWYHSDYGHYFNQAVPIGFKARVMGFK